MYSKSKNTYSLGPSNSIPEIYPTEITNITCKKDMYNNILRHIIFNSSTGNNSNVYQKENGQKSCRLMLSSYDGILFNYEKDAATWKIWGEGETKQKWKPPNLKKISCSPKQVRHNKTNIVWFIYMSKQNKSIG